MVEIRLLRTPQTNPRNVRRKLVRRPHKMLIDLQYLCAIRIVEIEHNSLFSRITERETNGELTVRIVMNRDCTDFDILDVVLRLCVEQNIPIDPREPPKILILKPACTRIAEDHRRQLVLARCEIRGQIEIRRCAAVLTVADEMSVEKERECRIHTAKGDENIFPVLRHGEILHIAADGIGAHGNLPRRDALVSVPRIRRIRIMRYTVSLHLDMRRHMDRLPVVTVVVRCLKALRDECRIPRIGKIPNAAERAVERGYAACQFHLIAVEDMVAVRRQAVLRKVLRVFQFLKIEAAHGKTSISAKKAADTDRFPNINTDY